MYGGGGGAVAVDAPANQCAFVLIPFDFLVFFSETSTILDPYCGAYIYISHFTVS